MALSANSSTSMTHRPAVAALSTSLPDGGHAALYRQIAHHLPGGAVFVVSHALIYLLADGEALNDVGMKPTDLEGKTVREVFGPDAADQAEADYRLILQGHNFEREHSVKGRYYLSRGTPLKGQDNSIQATLVISYDITRRLQAEQALQEADRQKDQFLAMLVHEMRGPLMPLLMGVELIKVKERAYGGTALPHAMMERQVRQLMRLVEDLADQGRLRLDKLHLERRRVCIKDILSQALDAVSAMIEQKKQVLVSRIQDAPMHIEADPTRLVQVFTNLIQNASKYSPPGSLIEISAAQTGNEIRIDVLDNGAGIPPDKLLCVFELFTQLISPTAEAGHGLGIGLALVKGLVEAHGGQVVAYSEGLGRGSRFTVRLPVIASL